MHFGSRNREDSSFRRPIPARVGAVLRHGGVSQAPVCIFSMSKLHTRTKGPLFRLPVHHFGSAASSSTYAAGTGLIAIGNRRPPNVYRCHWRCASRLSSHTAPLVALNSKPNSQPSMPALCSGPERRVVAEFLRNGDNDNRCETRGGNQAGDGQASHDQRRNTDDDPDSLRRIRTH